MVVAFAINSICWPLVDREPGGDGVVRIEGLSQLPRDLSDCLRCCIAQVGLKALGTFESC